MVLSKWLSHRDMPAAYPDEIGTELDEALNEPDEGGGAVGFGKI